LKEPATAFSFLPEKPVGGLRLRSTSSWIS
jgi:hypothetical protein